MKLPTKTEVSVKVFLLAFFLYLTGVSRGYPEKSALFPGLLGGVTAILIVISLAMDVIRFQKKGKVVAVRPDHPKEPSGAGDKEEEDNVEDGYEFLAARDRRRRLVQTLSLMLISLIVGLLGGFLWIVPFFFIAFGFLQGERGKRFNYIFLALAFTGVTYLFFVVLMGVPLLRGIWWG